MALLNPVTTEPVPGEPWVLLDAEHVVPRRFTATVHHVGGRLEQLEPGSTPPRGRRLGGAGRIYGYGGVQVLLAVVIEQGGAPRCERLEIQRQPPENEPLSATSVRVPLDGLMRIAVTDAMRALPEAGGEYVTSPGLEEREDFHAKYRKGAPRRAARPAHAEVARVYRAALDADGRAAPKRAVANAFFVSFSTAGRWIKEARAAGELGEARPGAASA